MTFVRPLSETLTELATGAFAQLSSSVGARPLRVESVEMSVPIDIRLAMDTEEFRGDLPLFRRATAFDPEPARLSVTFGEVAR